MQTEPKWKIITFKYVLLGFASGRVFVGRAQGTCFSDDIRNANDGALNLINPASTCIANCR